MDVIIDGYNLIFQCGLEGANRNPRTIEESRDRLIGMLAKLLSPTQISRTTIVYDAKRLPVSETQADSRKSGFRVLFAVGYDDADSKIEELIAAHSSPKKLLVVSSDHRIQTAATRRKANAIDSDVWLDKLEQSAAASPKVNATGQSDLDDLANIDWKAEFGAANIKATEDLIRSQQTGDSADAVEDAERAIGDVDWIAEMGLEDFEATD